MAMKKTEIELEIVENVETTEIEISGEPEDNMPDPVPASQHIADMTWASTPMYAQSKLLPVVATILASVVTGAALVATGIIIGAGL